MRFIADLHIHSRYSRATSSNMSPEGIWRWAQIKGISIIGAGDLTHPEWLKELRQKLEPAGNGLFVLRDEFRTGDVPPSCRSDVFFVLSGEISCIYTKKGRTRRIHSLILAPDFACAAHLNRALCKIGNLHADGRPILGLNAKELLKIILDASPEAMLIPAHAWTPHFSVFGSGSGFDSLEECFEDMTQYIHAIETGLSSDPTMNWRLSSLDRITLVSNSDAHSVAKIGREANILDIEPSYPAMTAAIKTRNGFLGTIELFPEEGKYHYDGHRLCGVSLSPSETIRHNYLCPVCGKKVTIGVMHRVEMLADRRNGFRPEGAPGFVLLIPLPELIAETLNVGVNTKKVNDLYAGLLERLGSELEILMNAPLDDIGRAGTPLIREAVSRMREGRIHISPGYDGKYGMVKIFDKTDRKGAEGQMKLL